MTLAVRWTTRASSQLEEAALYLESSRAGVGMEFLDSVEAILHVAAEHPSIFPLIPDVPGNEVRKGLIRKYGYWVIYEISTDQLQVLSVWHGARESEGWRTRP